MSQQIDLLPGEDIAPDIEEILNSSALTDEAINAKYIKGEVRIVTEQARYPLNQIGTMLASGNYQRNPEFQRRHRWNQEKQSRLIESFIMNVPVPPIFLYEAKFSYYEVMDGLQRLTAIDDFYNNRFALIGLEQWPELNGRTYLTLPEQVRRGIDRRYLSSIILLQETAKNELEAQVLKQLVFERINSGGVRLEDQEARNAIYNGPLNQLCIELSRNPYLCRTWGIPEPTEDEIKGGAITTDLSSNKLYQEMIDVELVLRFFAYRQRLMYHRGALKQYLDRYMQAGNLFPPPVLAGLKQIFSSTIALAYELFGKKAFWLRRKRERTGFTWYQRPTTVVYDPLMFALSQYLGSCEVLLAKKSQISSDIEAFYDENYQKFEGRYTNLSNVAERNVLFVEFFRAYIA